MAEGERLTGLCSLRSLPELTNAIIPDAEPEGVADFQHLLVSGLTRELSSLLAYLSGQGRELLNWVLVRYQVENLKVLLRVCLTRSTVSDLQRYLVPLPRWLTLDTEGLSAAESLDDFVRLAPRGWFRKCLEEAVETERDHLRPFFLEASLDQAYLQGLLARVAALPEEDREMVKPVACQEVDLFHLMLVARGRFHYALAPDTLRPYHIAGTRIRRSLFSAMLDDQDLYTSVSRVIDTVFDAPPFEQESGGHESTLVDVGVLEHLAWQRFYRLANLAFRQSHMGLAAVFAYAGIRRVETANLITLSEGIRKGLAPDAMRARLIARGSAEAPRV